MSEKGCNGHDGIFRPDCKYCLEAENHRLHRHIVKQDAEIARLKSEWDILKRDFDLYSDLLIKEREKVWELEEVDYADFHTSPEFCTTWYDGCRCTQVNLIAQTTELFKQLQGAQGRIERAIEWSKCNLYQEWDELKQILKGEME